MEHELQKKIWAVDCLTVRTCFGLKRAESPKKLTAIRRMLGVFINFGDKTTKKPKASSKQKRPSKTENSLQGALFGIPRAIIEQNAKPGESYDDAALRLLNESKRKRAST